MATKQKSKKAAELQAEKKQVQATPQFQTAQNSETPQIAPESSKSGGVPDSGEKPAKTEVTSLIQSIYSLIESGNFKKAIMAIDQALEIAPTDMRVLMLKVQLLLFLRRLRDADKTATRIIELYPGNHHVYLAKAISTLLYTNNLAESIQYLNKGLELKSDCIELVLAKAQILYLMSDPAYNAWVQQASEIDPPKTELFLKKYWIESLPEPPSYASAQIHGLLQTLMFLASQQAFGGWK